MLLSQLFGQLYFGLFQFFSLFGEGVVVGSEREDGGLEWDKPFTVLFLVVVENGAVFFVDEGVVALLALGGLHRIHHPFLEFKVLGVRAAVEPKLKILFALPKLLRRESEHFSSLQRHCFLIGVVVFGVVRLEGSSVSILVEQKLGQIVVFE